MSFDRNRWIAAMAVMAATGFTSVASAQTLSRTDRKFLGGDLSFNGLFRVETAFSTSDQTAPANQHGDPANGVAINREAGNPATGFTTPLPPGGIVIPGGTLPGVGVPLNLSLGAALPPTKGVSNLTGTTDTITRYVPSRDQDLNYHILRFEVQPTVNWSNGFSFLGRLRAVYDPGDMGYQDFDMGRYDDINDGFETAKSGPQPRQFGGKPDYMGYQVDNKKHPLWFERSGKHYMVDLPAFFGQWSNGNVTVRLGNQSVAWGQLLFFRLMDVANGLDLRRHLFIDRAIEEFADERMSAPGLRLTWQATDQIVFDSFAQQFIPTVLMNVNTPYNIVASQFILHDNYYDNDYNTKFNYGFRVKGEFGSYNGQFMYTSRLNQLGSIRWAKSEINKALPNTNALGLAFNQYCNTLAPLVGYESGNGCGPFLAGTAFEVAPAGVLSAEEWFAYASYTKLDALEGLDRAIDDFPAAQLLLTSTVNGNPDAANNELDAFFMASEGLHGHIERNYYREHIFGVGGGYVTEGEPGSLFDQIIVNLEATYAMDRKFTAVDLRHEFDERDEVQIGLVLEKYQRFSQSFPATYMVFQYLWQKESDLAGLLLDGYGSENFSDQDVQLFKTVPTSENPKITPGVNSGANYVVLAALQPTPAYIFEYSIAMLVDVQGGILAQPAVQWKPRGNVTVNLFYNFIDADVWGGNANKNLMSFIDFADELCLRVGYQF